MAHGKANRVGSYYRGSWKERARERERERGRKKWNDYEENEASRETWVKWAEWRKKTTNEERPWEKEMPEKEKWSDRWRRNRDGEPHERKRERERERGKKRKKKKTRCDTIKFKEIKWTDGIKWKLDRTRSVVSIWTEFVLQNFKSIVPFDFSRWELAVEGRRLDSYTYPSSFMSDGRREQWICEFFILFLFYLNFIRETNIWCFNTWIKKKYNPI